MSRLATTAESRMDSGVTDLATALLLAMVCALIWISLRFADVLESGLLVRYQRRASAMLRSARRWRRK